jgi:hypothetical protein
MQAVGHLVKMPDETADAHIMNNEPLIIFNLISVRSMIAFAP